MESRLRDDIPELQWEDLAENWDKIRLWGRTRDPYQRVDVTIARKEAPGPFHLRITVYTVAEDEAKAFHRAMVHRLQLSLLASAAGNTTMRDTVAGAPHGLPFVPPFFSLESHLDVPAGLEPSMALRIREALPDLAWTDLAQDWEQVRIVGKSRDAVGFTLVSIARDASSGPFQIWIHTTARSWFAAQGAIRAILERAHAAIFGPSTEPGAGR